MTCLDDAGGLYSVSHLQISRERMLLMWIVGVACLAIFLKLYVGTKAPIVRRQALYQVLIDVIYTRLHLIYYHISLAKRANCFSDVHPPGTLSKF